YHGRDRSVNSPGDPRVHSRFCAPDENRAQYSGIAAAYSRKYPVFLAKSKVYARRNGNAPVTRPRSPPQRQPAAPPSPLPPPTHPPPPPPPPPPPHAIKKRLPTPPGGGEGAGVGGGRLRLAMAPLSIR